jgi:ATP-dependent exoDNAse (exonuclease V) beta subunit
LIDSIGYRDYLNDGTPQAEDRLTNVDTLLAEAQNFATLPDLLEEVALMSSADKESDEGKVTLMTLHAAKGLEFPVVIIPHLSWDLKTSWGNHFVEAEDDVVLYSKLSKTNVPDYMLNAFKLEYDQLLLDELNTLYVAFTRPSERLYVLTETKQPSAKDGFFTQINQPLALSVETWNDEQVTEKTEDVIKFGEETKITKDNSNTGGEGTNFIPKDLSDFLWFPELSLQDEEALETEVFNDEQQFGNELHLVLSEIKRENRIDEVIAKLKMDGLIEPKFQEEIKKTANATYALIEGQDFAQNAEKVLDEQDILISEKEVKRPDKLYITGNKAVVVDFKTGEPLNKHNSQVFNYCKQLSDMGFEETEGYLLYTQSMELKKVK